MDEILLKDKEKFEKDKEDYINQSQLYDQFKRYDNLLCPYISDYRAEAGTVDSHYFFQDIYVAKRIKEDGISHVWDIGSRVDGFISHLLAMEINVTMIDIRQLPYNIEHLDFIEGDATNLQEIPSNEIQTLTSLHALEHFGLGRYGDKVDFFGWKKALNEYKRIIKPGGRLWLSVPIADEDILQFNAHRIFKPLTIIYELIDDMKICEFSFLQNGKRLTFDFQNESSLHNFVNIIYEIQNSYLTKWDCGIFCFEKK